jgi:hypothetical protein
LRRAQEVATSFDLPVMIHIGQTTTPMSTRPVGLQQASSTFLMLCRSSSTSV